MTAQNTVENWDQAGTTALIPPQTLLRNTVKRVTLDLTTKNGALVVACVARLWTTGLTGNFYFRIRRMQLPGLTNKLSVPAPYVDYTGGSANSPTTSAVQNTTVAAGVTAINMTATPTGFVGAAGAPAIICACGSTTAPGTTATVTLNLEFMKCVAAWSSTNTTALTAVWVDAPTSLPRLASEVISNLAEIAGPYWLEGGAVYEILFDYASATAGEPLGIACYAEYYTSDQTQ